MGEDGQGRKRLELWYGRCIIGSSNRKEQHLPNNYVSINPGPASEQPKDGKREFAALVKVESSRYVEHTYQDSNLRPKVAIRWVMRTTKDNTFERDWSTGIVIGEGETLDTYVSANRKQLKTKIKQNSDANYFLRKAINEAGYPSNRVTDDISVFEGETFFLTTDANPLSQGSARKPYPKQYHPEGWETAKSEAIRRRMERELATTGGNETATMTGKYTPPPIVIQPDVRTAATEALVAILTTANGRAVQRDLLTGLNKYIDTTKPLWANTPSFRENVTRAIWDYAQITTILQDNPRFAVDGGPIGFTVILK